MISQVRFRQSFKCDGDLQIAYWYLICYLPIPNR